MKIITGADLGYREISRLAGFALAVCAVGVPGDVVKRFGYDLKKDRPYIVTCDNKIFVGKLAAGVWSVVPDMEV